MSVALTGTIVKWLSVALLVPFATSLVYGEDTVVFLASIGVALVVGGALERLSDDRDLGPPEALLFVALAWIAVSIVGAVPYLLAAWTNPEPTTLSQPVNALFESTSGFTTTGATVLGEISTAHHSHALMLWRQLTQWLGGMGIIVLMIAILPELAVNGAQLMSSEAPGPELQKLTPRIAETARVLWQIYLGFTLLFFALMASLHLLTEATALNLAPNMDLYNAVAHAFSTLPTGGFSPQSDSIGAFSPLVQWAFVPFMVVAGTNFALFWYVLHGDGARVLRDPEFRAYLGALATIGAVLFGLLFAGVASDVVDAPGQVAVGELENAARQAAFQIGSLMNSTGYATSDFEQWDAYGKVVLLFAMFVGGSAGSTGGGIKVVRWLVVLKAAKRELVTAAHPETVQPITLGDHVLDEGAVRGVLGFTLLYVVLYGVGTVVIALDCARQGLGLEPLEAMSASLATIGNVGPGFGFLGPFGSYVRFPRTTKLFMILLMWIGRLEIIPVLVLFTGSFWRR